MRAGLIAAAVLLLSSCASFEGPVQTSTGLNGQSFQSMDMTNPHFYMDNDAVPPAYNRASAVQPVSPNGIDSYCGYCRNRHGWTY
jgi:hypothetical protein